jgi:hypothetical protein
MVNELESGRPRPPGGTRAGDLSGLIGRYATVNLPFIPLARWPGTGQWSFRSLYRTGRNRPDQGRRPLAITDATPAPSSSTSPPTANRDVISFDCFVLASWEPRCR